MKILLKKVFREMKLYKGRTLLALIGVMIGAVAVGSVLSSYAILEREMQRNFMDTNPASMVFAVSNLDKSAEGIIKGEYPGTIIDTKKTVQARISRGDGTWGTIILRAVRDFENQSVDTFALEKGSYAQKVTQILLERDCLKILPALTKGVGETVQICLPGKDEKDLSIIGLVHAPGLAPASMENFSYGFITLDTLKYLGDPGWYNEIRVVSLQDRFDESAMRQMAADIKGLLQSNGYTVKRVDVPPPGKHPHADQLTSLLFLLQAFTVIALLAASLIIVNLMNFIMSRQSRQIAIQKAVGGTTCRIALPYFLYVLAVGVGAIAVSIPLSVLGGSGYALFAAEILNFDIGSFAIPAWVFIAEVLTGLLVPLTAAAWPILKSCAASVKSGLAEKLVSIKGRKKREERVFMRRNATITLAASNLMRRKARTILAVLALVAGGVLFMTAQNITASIDRTADASMNAFKWDYDLRLAGKYDNAALEKAAQSVEGLQRMEVWQGSAGVFISPDGTNTTSYTIKIAPEDSRLIDLPELNAPGNFIIINKALADEEKWIEQRNTLTMQAGDATGEVRVLQIIDEVPAIPAVYMSSGNYVRLYGAAPSQMMLASANTRDVMQQRGITRDIESEFRKAGINLAENWNIYALRKAFVDHLKVIVTFLTVMAFLAVTVGGLGIGSAIGINISERKHETGVLRAIGATSRRIYALILMEVLLMGLSGWLAGTLLSLPVSVLVGNYFGQIFLHTNLNNMLSLPGSAVWLVISLAVALFSGRIPVRKAVKASLQEMLAYE